MSATFVFVLGTGRSPSAPNAKIGTSRPACLIVLRKGLRKGRGKHRYSTRLFRLPSDGVDESEASHSNRFETRGAVLACAAMPVPPMSPKSPLLPAQVGIGQVAVVSTWPVSDGLDNASLHSVVQHSGHHPLRGQVGLPHPFDY